MRQAIETRFIGPTNFRGARVKASAQAGSVMVPYEYEAQRGGAHRKAAEALIRKMGWFGLWAVGAAPGAKGDVFVFVSSGPDLEKLAVNFEAYLIVRELVSVGTQN